MKLTADPADLKYIRKEAQLSADDLLKMKKASKAFRKTSGQAAKLVKSILRKLTLMQQKILESIWTQLSPLGQQTVLFYFYRLLECSNDEEKRIVLERLKSSIVLDNGLLEDSEQLFQFIRVISQVSINRVVGLMNPVGQAKVVRREAKGSEEDATGQNALQMNAPMGTISLSPSSDEDLNTGSEHSNE